MIPPDSPKLFLLAASLATGLAAGWAMNPHRKSSLTDSPTNHPQVSRQENASSAEAAPFSMDSFRAASGLPMHRLLARVLPKADATLIRTLADDLAARPESPPAPVWNALFVRWTALDGPAAFAWARSVEGKDLAKTALTAWAEADVEAALAATEAGGNNYELLSVHQVLVQTDAARALALFEERRATGDPSMWIDSNFIHQIYLHWGRQDPDAAAAHLATSERPLDEAPLWRNLASGWARKDSAGCRDWLDGLRTPFRSYALQGLTDLITEDPARVAGIAGSLPPTDEYSLFRLQAAGLWAEQDAPAALAWVRQFFPEGPQRLEALAKVAGSVMEKNLPAAVALMDEIGWDNGERSRAAQNRLILPGTEHAAGITQATGNREETWSPSQTIYSLLKRLGRVDPELAARCYERTVAAGNPASLESFVPDWFAQQPEAAMRWLAAQPADRIKPSGLNSLFENTLSLDPETARNWALRLPAGPTQQALAALSAADSSLGDPATAADAIPFTHPASRQAALGEIIRDWSATAPQSALDRLLREPTPMPETCEAVLMEWTQRDPGAASKWVAAQPPGPNRDAAIRGLTTTLTDFDGQPDFPAALSWSLSITDPASRLKVAQSILEGRDQNGAALEEIRITLETTSALAEKERQALLRLLKP